MKKQKRKLTAAEKKAKRQRKKEYMTIFIRGKQKRVKQPPKIDGVDVDEFIRRDADPIWLTQNEMWEELHAWETARNKASGKSNRDENESSEDDSDIPF